MDVCLQGLPVTLLIDRAGLVGADGATHQGVFDLSFLRQMPGMVIASPRDVRDLRRLLRLSVEQSAPFAIRYAKDADDMGPGMQEHAPLRVGEWELLAEGTDAMILAVGRMVETALGASIELHGKGVSCGVIDARFIKPMDEHLLREAAETHPLLVTLEDNVVAGGFGAGVLEQLGAWGLCSEVLTLGVPDRFIEHGAVEEQIADCGLNAAQVAARILRRLEAMGRGANAGG